MLKSPSRQWLLPSKLPKRKVQRGIAQRYMRLPFLARSTGQIDKLPRVRIVLSVPNKIADKISDTLQLRPESTNILQELRYFL
jgi:tRNA A37 methylthiotransferase MiaB